MHALAEVLLLLYQCLRTRTEYTYLTFCFPPETCAEEHYTPSSDKINQQTRLLKGLNYCNHFMSRFLCTGSWTLNCKINLDFRAWFTFCGFFSVARHTPEEFVLQFKVSQDKSDQVRNSLKKKHAKISPH